MINDFLSLAAARYSVRKYDPAPVEQEKIDAILEAARLAPTARNYQPQMIYIVRSEAARKALGEVCNATYHAPVIFVVGYDSERSHKGYISDFGDADAAIVTTHMMMEATQLGLGTCWVGKFKEAEVREVLNIPDNIHLLALLPTGYAAEDAAPSFMHDASRQIADFVEER